MKGKTIFRGMAALMAVVMLLVASATTITFKYSGTINSLLDISTSEVVTTDDASNATSDYYVSQYGTDPTDEKSIMDMEIDVALFNIEAEEEGAVLLKNENNALPIAQGSQITVFGNAAYNSQSSVMGGVSYIEDVTFTSAMQEAFGAENVNSTLVDNVYSSMPATTTDTVYEAEIDDVKAYESTWQNEYNDAAVVVLAREGSEGNDVYMYSTEGRHMLGLSANEEALMQYLKEEKDAGVFGNIIVILNSAFALELDWLEDYGVDACLMVNEVGQVGFTGVANIMSGEANPSGHLVDTYAANSLSAPATTYAAHENTQTWANAEEMNAYCTDNGTGGDRIDYYVVYAEDIYVGYKYYETRYEDTVLGQGNASGVTGSSTGSAWNYADEVCYPFGYGLSYTTFDETLDDVSYDEATDNYTLTVTVENTGDVAGKDVVEVYAQTPYGEYEKENGVEKSSVLLVGYAKTDMLDPGASETVTVDVMRYMLASYDTNGAEGYILSAGDYYLAVGEDAHDALNNILSAKGYTTGDGMTEDGNASLTYSWNQSDLDTESYKTSIYTDEEVTDAFDFASPDYYGYDFTFLTRSDWDGTFPAEAIEPWTATQDVMDDLNADWYETPSDAPAVSDFTTGADNGLQLIDMRLVDFDDDETWDLFLDQLTAEELSNLMADNTAYNTISRLGVPGADRTDSNAGVGGVAPVAEPVISASWNDEIAYQRGYTLGLETYLLKGCNENWYGGGDTHRTPFGGRANQYWSEDGNFAYLTGYNVAEGMQDAGVIMCVKHFAMNDQETQREGLTIFAQEQPIREEYLRAFEGAFAGGAQSTMCSLSRIGTIFSGNCSSMLTTVLRDEWGYTGHVTTDGYVGLDFMCHYLEGVTAGLDYICMDSDGDYASAVLNAINDGDGYILQAARTAAKRNLYTEVNSISINGISSNSYIVTIVPTWQQALVYANYAAILLFAVFAVLAIVSTYYGGKKKSEEKEEDKNETDA